MSLRGRVFLGLALLLVVTVLAAWMVAGGTVLRQLVGDIERERGDVMVHIAQELERAQNPRERAAELEHQLGVQIELRPGAGWGMRRHGRTMERDGRTIYVGPGREPSRMAVALGDRGMAMVRFPLDLEKPRRRVRLGLLLLGIVAILGAVGVSRWVLRPLELTSEAMDRVASGDLDHRLPSGDDVTGRMGGTFNRMAEQVQGMVVGQRQLMAAVSHELRTPLARMRLSLEMLRDEGAEPRRIERLEADINEVDQLVEELLESSRLDQGVVALRREDVLVGELYTQALGAVDLGEREVTLDVPDDLYVFADRQRVGRALTNLLSNIARYTPDGVDVALRARATAQGVELIVEDRGPGVSADALPHLFEPFYRTESSRSRKTGGLGLGLMLVRQVVEAHGGHVRVANRPGGGLRFDLSLPARAG